MAMDMQNRRRYARIDAQLPLKLFVSDVDFITETINLSCGGAYCRIGKFIPIMTKFKIMMFVPGEGKKKSHKIQCEGIVVRTEPEYPSDEVKDYKVAIFFSTIKKTDRAKIADYVKRKAQHNPAWN